MEDAVQARRMPTNVAVAARATASWKAVTPAPFRTFSTGMLRTLGPGTL
jgi:hypothetical protein